MSQDDTNNSADSADEGNSAPDPIKNLKSEVTRKLSNTESQIEALTKQNQVILEQLQMIASTRASQTSAQTESESSEEFDPYDPKSVKKYMASKLESGINSVKSELMEQQRRERTLGELFNEYPELQDSSSDIAKRTLEAFNQLPVNVRSTPEGYRLAVREAAAQTGILPKSKRRRDESSEEFVMGTPAPRSTSSRNNGGDEKLSDDTLAIAQLMGLDVSKKDVVDRLKKRAKRKNWSKYSDG